MRLNQFQKGHTYKVQYQTLRMAEMTAQQLREEKGRDVQPYRCRVCGKYHLGRPKGWRDTEPTNSHSRVDK